MNIRNHSSKLDKAELFDIIRKVPLFSGLNEQELRTLADIAVEIKPPRDSLLIIKDTLSTELYIVLEGEAHAISINEDDGNQIVLNTFNSGDYFGEMSFIDKEPRCATVQTKGKTRLLRIPRNKFKDIIASNPEIVFNLMKGLLVKLRHATEQIEAFAFKDSYGKIVSLLAKMAKPKENYWVIEEKLTQADIANRIGCDRSTVSKILSSLKAGNYLTHEKKIITIRKQLPDSY
ncbi:MAG: Crp/Fnr family transcriptional regulator [Desulfococcaceae bacterium]